MPTLRQTIGELLKSGPQSARTISQAVAVREREVYDHLDHYIIMDVVELEDVSDAYCVLGVEGPGASGVR